MDTSTATADAHQHSMAPSTPVAPDGPAAPDDGASSPQSLPPPQGPTHADALRDSYASTVEAIQNHLFSLTSIGS